jgi:hypothetical protein
MHYSEERGSLIPGRRCDGPHVLATSAIRIVMRMISDGTSSCWQASAVRLRIIQFPASSQSRKCLKPKLTSCRVLSHPIEVKGRARDLDIWFPESGGYPRNVHTGLPQWPRGRASNPETNQMVHVVLRTGYPDQPEVPLRLHSVWTHVRDAQSGRGGTGFRRVHRGRTKPRSRRTAAAVSRIDARLGHAAARVVPRSRGVAGSTLLGRIRLDRSGRTNLGWSSSQPPTSPSLCGAGSLCRGAPGRKME